jgi:hypothetical protein
MRLPPCSWWSSTSTSGWPSRNARYVLSHGTVTLAAPAAELRDNLSPLQASYLGEANGSVATTDRRSP